MGPLGLLAPGVVGGYHDGATAEVEARIRSLPALDVVTNPFFPEPLRGHDTLVIRGSSGMWEWMAADEEAQAEARTILRLDTDGLRYLVVVIEPVPSDARDAVRALLDRKTDPNVAGQLRIGKHDMPLTSAVLEFETPDPDAVVSALRAHLPASAVGVMRAGHRAAHTMRFVPCWPPGSTHFTQPR